MSNTIKEDIYNALNELTEKQFKEFKWWLNTINYDGRPKIPKASLGKADLQHEVVDLLIQHYGEDALEICTDVLRKCNRNDLAKNLEETKDVDAHQLPISSEYRNYIKKKYAMIKDPNAIPGEYLPLNQRYSKLIILDNHQSEEEKEDEILAMGRKHLEIISKRAEVSTSIETLFNPDKYGLTPQIVVLQGAAGIGKTMMAKKIIFDWASQQLYQNKFNYVFYISCSEMNFHAESQKTSIAEIISNEWLKCQKVKNVIENILRNEEKLLFIIDGFDELRHSFNQAENYCCIDPWKKEPVRIILSNLFQKRILPKSSLIITTRPTALEKLYQCLEHPRCFEILGFSTKEREEYFYTFFEKKDQATQALRFVKQNDTLFTMCVIPLVSWIICTVMKQELERGKDLQKTPYTLTAIYMLYLSSLLKFHHKESKQDVQANVKGLSSLAAEGVSKRKIFFMEKEVKKHGLDQKDIPLFLNQSVFKRDIDCIETYSFIHLSFQEFFAALFYVLEEGDEQHSKKWGKNLQTLLETHRSFRSDFVVGFHFLFGLLNEEKRMRELRKEFGWEISPKNKEFLLNWVKNNIPKRRHNFQLQKEMFSYLYETRDDNFIKNAVCSITEIDYQSNSDMELMILAYCIQHCQNLKYLFAKGSAFLSHAETELHLPEDKEWNLDERYMEDFFKALTKLRNLRELRLNGWSFTESCSRQLAEVFKKNQRLKMLHLAPKDIDDRAAELLCEGLQHVDCKVETLVLSGEILIKSCSRHLAKVLRKNQRLRELTLYLKNPDDKIMEVLCDGLKQPECTIETLNLTEGIITKSGSRHLAEVIRKKQRLKLLYLYLNKEDNEAVELLCEGLKHPECTVKTLELAGEILTESCSRNLAEVLRKKQSLRELTLFLKNTDDKIMEVLCDGLKQPECTIETLKLTEGVITKSGSRHLAEVIRKKQRLKTLYLKVNNDDNEAMEVLCEGLKHTECTVKTLELAGEILTESCSRNLAEVLRKNQSLRELMLFLNNLDDKIMEVLCDGLKKPECTIETLKLNEGVITKSGSRHLAEVIRNKQRLKTLYLKVNNDDNEAMEVLCEGLKHPECTVKTLELAGEILTESCSRNLAEVLMKNQSLRELTLFLNNLDDKIMEVLCDGLKKPKCTIETLKLTEGVITKSGSRHLAEVIRKKQRLKTLYLKVNNDDNEAMEVLCEGLKHPECTVKTLELAGEILTEYCSWNLAEVLRKNQSLRELMLFLNNLDDKIMEVLCDGLKKPECTIETLKLTEGVITKSGSRHLAEVVRKKQRLKTLYLKVNNDDNESMEVLCEGLKHPECTVKTLELAGEILTESCSRNLAEVLRKNQSLRELTLFLNNLDDKIMEVLCDGLKKKECTIETLKLTEGVITKSGSRHLAEVIRKKQRLKTLYLKVNNDDNEAMEVLFEGLKHPECTVKTLELAGEILTEYCSLNLAEVLRKNQSLRELTLFLNNLDDKIMEVLCDGLKKPECTIETLKLTEGVITKSGSRHLAEVVRKKQRLKTLYLKVNNDDNESMEVLCEGLKHPECTVKKIELAGEILTEYCSLNLAEVLRKNQSLRELTLFLNNLDDKIMEVLCDGLKKPECTIETLKLTEGVITKSGSRHLAEVIRKKQRLKTLYLNVNNDDNEAMEVLCEGLKHTECTVKTLELDGEILTESCSRNLAEVLRKNQSLRELTLFLNNLDDKIMEVLCDGLKKPECTIETLKLNEGVITKSGSRHLAEVIRKKQRLKTLYLKVNNDDNEAMEVLCEGLKHPECTVKTLELDGDILTEYCSWNLAEVLRKNQSLRELTLFLKNLDDKIMEVLCDGLKKPECTIETLKLTEGVITKSGSRHLAEVIRKKQRLKTLYLKVNNDDNEAMEVLCEGLKHPGCTVKTLELAGDILTESCSRNLAEVLRKNQSLREFTLFLNNLDDKIMEVLCDGLKKPECTIETLKLTEGVITKSGSRHLAEVIRKKQRLKTLYLKVNNDDNEAMEVLCEGLKHPGCTVKTLELAGDILTESCSRNLAEVLRKNQSLREFTLFLNNLDDKIMEVLCDGLKKPECTIETLKLTEGVITKSGSRHLAEVIRKKQRLKTLYLKVNNDDNEAMEVLCEGLKHSECNVKTLELAGEILTESCSRNLAEVLRKNQSLREFTLFLNNLDDKIMEVLCDGLKKPECTIETLKLTEGVITKSGSRHLAEVIRKKQRLKTLYLKVNNDDNEAMEVLCEGLKHPECTVKTLELGGEILTESCSRNLAEVLRKNQSLRELTLFLKNLDDKIMEVLCDGLKKPECTIETLKLTEGVITKSGSRHLAELIRKKQRLKTLYLYVNNDDNEAMEVLCEGLKHPECTVKTLKLDGEILTESCSRNLAKVLRKNQNLRELTLFLNNLDDKIMEVLCDGLKQPECTIETLKLNGKIYCMIRKTNRHESHCWNSI
ncbi:uncharacterized protein [Erythrolamprus reginae]|uniref:uncharacterized protein n=1 Tax=Erythrolamprus reginae TaxID=121349 RepID=UPI00396CACE9